MSIKRSFNISDKEVENFENWFKKHDKHCPFSYSKIPRTSKDKKPPLPPLGWGRFTYEFFPTPIGCIIKVLCECGEKIDITDYEAW